MDAFQIFLWTTYEQLIKQTTSTFRQLTHKEIFGPDLLQ